MISRLLAFFQRCRSLANHHRQHWWLGVVLFGLVLRSIYPGGYSFGFDQVQIAEAADAILQGDVTLIGPRTGPAAMFTGPLIYYWAAGWALVLPTHWAVVMTALSIAAATGLVTWYLVRRYLPAQLQLSYLFIWASSPFIVMLDRVPWNPNLTFLAAALTFLPLLTRQPRFQKSDMALMSVGIFLGYQAHFSGLFLLPLAALTILLFHRHWLAPLISLTAGLALSLAPTFLFDVRHDWLNSRGLWSLLNRDNPAIVYEPIWVFLHKCFIVIETLAKVLAPQTNPGLVLVLGLTLLGLFGVATRNSNRHRTAGIVGTWLMVVVVSFSFYRESTPEYYFLILLPIFLLVITLATHTFFSHSQRRIMAGVFAGYACIMTILAARPVVGFPLGIQLQSITEIKKLADTVGVRELRLEMDDLSKLGINYLLEHDDFHPTTRGKVIHLVYPQGEKEKVSTALNRHVVIWIDP